MEETKAIFCPFCGFHHTVKENQNTNIMCNCGAKWYCATDEWYERNGKKRIKRNPLFVSAHILMQNGLEWEQAFKVSKELKGCFDTENYSDRCFYYR